MGRASLAHPTSPRRYWSSSTASVESLGEKFTLIVESGRYLSAESTIMVSRVVNVKKFDETKYVYLDAGYHNLLDSALLRHEYPVEVIPGGTSAPRKTVLSGRLCDALDIFPTSSRSKLGRRGGRQARGLQGRRRILVRPRLAVPLPAKALHPHAQRQGNHVVVRKGQSLDELFEEEGGDLVSQKAKRPATAGQSTASS